MKKEDLKQKNYHYEISDLVPEKDKEKEGYLIGNIDNIIRNLVYYKRDLHRAYHYYEGRRDNRKFRWLLDNYGVGNPMDLPFISLIRPRVDALLGVQLDHPLNYKITSNNTYAYDHIENEKKKSLLEKYVVFLKKKAFETKLKSKINKDNLEDSTIEKELQAMLDEHEESFISSLEVLSQKVLKYFIYKKNLKYKFKELFKHLLITGECYYRVYIPLGGTEPELKICNPLYFYHKKTVDTEQIKNCTEVVYKEHLTRTEILNEYGHLMTPDERKEVSEHLSSLAWKTDDYYHYNPAMERTSFATGLERDEGIYLHNQEYGNYETREELIDVYHVEWLANNEIKDKSGETRYRLDRYEGIRIGAESGIYLGMGKSENIQREMDTPYTCSLTYNGMTYSDTNSKPHSLVLSLEEIQDKSDLLQYKRENILAHARPGGVAIDIPSLWNELGDTSFERIEKTIAYMNEGIKLTNSSQEGVNPGGQFGTSDFPSNIDAGAIQAFTQVIQICDEIASQITGVNRQMLGQVMERDGLGVTRQAMASASIITRSWFNTLDTVIGACLTDLLNASRLTFDENTRGTYILNNKSGIFSINKEFLLSSFGVFATDGNQEMQDMLEAKQVAMEYVKGGAITIDAAMQLIGVNSISEVKSVITREKRKMEENELIQAKQQLQDMAAQMQQMEDQLKQAAKKIEKLNELELQLKQQELQLSGEKLKVDAEDKKERRRIDEEYKDGLIELKKQTVELEKHELILGSSQSKEISDDLT